MSRIPPNSNNSSRPGAARRPPRPAAPSAPRPPAPELTLPPALDGRDLFVSAPGGKPLPYFGK